MRKERQDGEARKKMDPLDEISKDPAIRNVLLEEATDVLRDVYRANGVSEEDIARQVTGIQSPERPRKAVIATIQAAWAAKRAEALSQKNDSNQGDLEKTK